MCMSQTSWDAKRRCSMPKKEMVATIVGLKETRSSVGGSPYLLKNCTGRKGIIDSMACFSEVHWKVSRSVNVQEPNAEYIHRPNSTKITKIAMACHECQMS